MKEIKFSVNSTWETFQDEREESFWEGLFTSGWEASPPAFAQLAFEQIDSFSHWAVQLRQSADFLIVIGLGGSSLGGKALTAFSCDENSDHDSVFFWEGVHPSSLQQLRKRLKKERGAVLFISKSGTTLETRVNFALLQKFFPGLESWFVTSFPENISDLCGVENLSKRVFVIPEDLGGRFSVASGVGLLPGLFMNADISSFVKGFLSGIDQYNLSIPMGKNSAKLIASQFYRFANAGFSNVIFWHYAKKMQACGDWLVQLWAESLGKEPDFHLFPISLLGSEDQHSQLQFFMDSGRQYLQIFVGIDFDPESDFMFDFSFGKKSLLEILNCQMKSIEMALDERKLPIAEFRLAKMDLWHLGRWMVFWMYVVAYLGYTFKINPFDQPGVEAGKVYCKKILNGEFSPEIFKKRGSI